MIYNDIDPYCCAWLRNLIAAGHLPNGDVIEGDFQEINVDDIPETAHFFAGIGGWPYALELVGWQGPVWTASLPCQPLSSAGKRRGHNDERHLWPAFYALVAERRPATIFGEQVSSKDGREWLAGIRADLEALGYAVGAANLCAAGAGEKAKGRISYEDNSFVWRKIVIGAPHIRQRLFWVAKSNGGHASTEGLQRSGKHGQQPENSRACGMGDAQNTKHAKNANSQRPSQGPQMQFRGTSSNGFWADCDWLPCTDGKARRIEPGSFPLVAGLSDTVVPSGDPSPSYAQNTAEARSMRLRGYGNAINVWVAVEFIRAFQYVLQEMSEGRPAKAHG